MAVLDADGAAGVAPPAVAPPPGHPRFALIDALRAIAALMVLVYHVGSSTSTGGAVLGRLNVGVALFFVISGFLLYRPFVAHRVLGAPGTRLRDYARRRLVRIVPAYWVALTVLAIWPGLPGVFTGHWWVYYGFLQAYDDNTVLQGIGPAWTLCVEVSFYVALPLWAGLAAGALRGRGRTVQIRAELIALGLVAAASIALRWRLAADAPFSPLLNTLPAFADWFALGMAVAVVSVSRQGSDADPAPERVLARAPWLAWLGAAIALWAASDLLGGPHPLRLPGHLILLFTPGESVGIHVLFGAVALGLIAPAVFGTGGGGWVRSLLSWRPLAWVGLISYGVYLWQQPLIDRACQPQGTGCRLHGIGLLQRAPFASLLVIGLAASVVVAAASYRLVERPALRLKYRAGSARP